LKGNFLKIASLAARENVKKWSGQYGSLPPGRRSDPPAFLADHFSGCGVITEIKLRSPSGGDLMGRTDPMKLARIYEEAGAEAISVVVEENHFGGSPKLFEKINEVTGLPLLWKDFVLDPYQVRLAASLGASAVLLIVGLTDDDRMQSLIKTAGDEGLRSLIEIHHEGELKKALSMGADLVGVNNRDLVSLKVDTTISKRMASQFPESLQAVSESGMRNSDDVRHMAGLGYRAVLVGEALVTADDPGTLLREMIRAGRGAEG
jgi:indole-3-glycerol phosphate synthase